MMVVPSRVNVNLPTAALPWRTVGVAVTVVGPDKVAPALGAVIQIWTTSFVEVVATLQVAAKAVGLRNAETPSMRVTTESNAMDRRITVRIFFTPYSAPIASCTREPG